MSTGICGGGYYGSKADKVLRFFQDFEFPNAIHVTINIPDSILLEKPISFENNVFILKNTKSIHAPKCYWITQNSLKN